MLTALGRWVIEQTVLHAQIAHLAYLSAVSLPAALKARLRPVLAVFYKQIYFTGYESLTVLVPVSMAIGTVIIAQIMALVGVGNASLAAKVLIWSVVRELGPLLTAMIVIARSGAAIATEIGTMKINGELDTLELLGVSIAEYLVLPRLLGVTLAVMALTVYFEIGAVLGGLLVASFGWHLPLEQFFQGLYSALTLRELMMSLGKSLFFGIAISATCCQQGLIVGRSVTMVPQAASKGVMHALFLVFILDGVMTLLSQLLMPTL